jgi:proliferating cell nuclear antigen
MDPSHVAMVDFELPASAFKDYSCQEPQKIKINLESMVKFLKRPRIGELVILEFDPKSKKIIMTLKNDIKKVYTIPILESTEEQTPTPKIEFNTNIKIASSSLKDIIEDTREVSDNVQFEAIPEKLIVSASTELSSGRFEIEKGAETMLDLHVKESSSATYNVNYLSDMIKAGSGASEILNLSFSTNMPLKLEFGIPQNGQIIYYLAPRIEAE